MAVNLQKTLYAILTDEGGGEVPFSLERQEVEGRGDYSSNIALVRAKYEHKSPMEIAERLAASIKEKYPDMFDIVEAAVPGFLNFYFSAGFVHHRVADFVRPSKRQKLGKASVEFISANPTGPLHVGNARSGPIGDVVANLLAEVGYKVTREYYHNDAGAQVERFRDSLWHWYLQALGSPSTLPENGYEGEYVAELGKEASKKWKRKLLEDSKGKEKLLEFAFVKLAKENFATIKRMGIRFNAVIKESVLLKTKTPKVLMELRKKNLLKEKDGATWFVSNTAKGVEEAVVIKSDGTPIYFANDIAYHKEKFSRSDFIVDVFGENHEAHIAKLRAVADVYSFPQERFKIVVYGQVTLKKGDQIVSMSKRKGNFVTAKDVLDAVGCDAFRFFMLEHAPRSAMQFDIELARERSKNNPVYYVQYAHARASGILKKSKKKIDFKKVDWSLAESLPELALIKHILAFPEVIEKTAHDFEVQRLTQYAYELARTFTHFYETSHVIGQEKPIEYTRLGIVALTRDMLRAVSRILGIAAPTTM